MLTAGPMQSARAPDEAPNKRRTAVGEVLNCMVAPNCSEVLLQFLRNNKGSSLIEAGCDGLGVGKIHES